MFTATAKNAVNWSHTKLSFLHNDVQFVANFLLLVYFSPVHPPRSRFLVLGRHRSLLRLRRSELTPMTTVAVNVAVAAIVTSRQGHVHVRVTKRVV